MRMTYKIILLLLALILVCIFPWVSDTYILYVGWIALLYAILALSLGLIMGYTGQPSFCHATFFGIGAYASVILVMDLGMPVWVGMVASVLVSGIFGLLIGFPALRLRGAYFAIVTLAFAIICSIVAGNPGAITRGTTGIQHIPAPEPVAFFGDLRFYFYLVLAFLLLTIFVFWRLINSRVGRAFIAIRENEDFANSVGVNPMKYKLLAFVIGAMFAGIAGSLYAHGTHYINSSMMTQGASFDLVMIVVVGGLGTLSGPVVGAVLLAAIPEYLRAVGTYRLIIYGIILILVLRFMPSGIVGGYKALVSKISERQRKGGEITNA